MNDATPSAADYSDAHKSRAKALFERLRDDFCTALEDIEAAAETAIADLVGELQAADIAALLRADGWSAIAHHRDLLGRDRATTATR